MYKDIPHRIHVYSVFLTAYKIDTQTDYETTKNLCSLLKNPLKLLLNGEEFFYSKYKSYFPYLLLTILWSPSDIN